jgi:TonB family protein
MKKIQKSVASFSLVLGTLAAVSGLSARTAEQAWVDSYQGRTDIPVPLSVVAPEVPSRHAGRVVEIEFVVNAAGRPEDMLLRSPASRDLEDSLRDAVAQWRFAPATRDGLPVARRVKVPFHIVDRDAVGSTFAAR